jgi:hypothetical protein
MPGEVTLVYSPWSSSSSYLRVYIGRAAKSKNVKAGDGIGSL